MTDLYEAQRHICRMIDKQPAGSAAKFKLMDAAAALSKAIWAIEQEDRQAPTPPMNGEAG